LSSNLEDICPNGFHPRKSTTIILGKWFVFLEEYKHLCIFLVFTIKNFIFAWLSCGKEEYSFFGEWWWKLTQ
jgi:hypothetical protein